MTIRDLTETEYAALCAYAADKGKDWKDRLLEDWYHARLTGELHSLRNDPNWSHRGLEAFDASEPHTLSAAPAWVAPERDETGKVLNPEALKWSCAWGFPAIGNAVRINFNGLGTGTVTGYFIEAGWLGVRVKLDRQPDWHKRQNGPGRNAFVFGAEIDPVDIERDPLAVTLGRKEA